MKIASRRGLNGVCALVVAMAAACAAGVGCGSGSSGSNGFTPSDGGDDGSAVNDGGGGRDGGDGGGFGNTPTVTALAVQPLNASITSLNGAKVTQQFKLIAQYSDGTTMPVTNGVTWGADAPAVGSLAGTGLFTANGALGGLVDVSATYMGKKAAATLNVKLLVQQNSANVPPGVQTSLQGATTPDMTTNWAYPYDGTVWPRGLNAPILQWMGGAASDDYYVHLTSASYELQAFVTSTGAPSSQIALAQATWAQFTDSSSGAATLEVARWDGSAATVVTKQGWSIAPASMRGTIYYWANNLGRIMRLTPGSTTPQDFSQGIVPAPTQGCSMACHTVSANGSSMIAAGGTFGGTYDLQNNKMGYSVGAGENSGPIRQWGLSSISPKGDYVIVNALMDALTGLTPDGIFSAGTGQPVANSGLSATEKTFMPAFSPDGTGFVFVTGSNPGTGYWLATGAPGPTAPTDPAWGWLKAYDFDETKTPMFTNERQLVGPGTDPSSNVIAWPTMSPDGQWVIYSRLNWTDPSMQHNLSSYPGPSGPDVDGDLYMASTKTPGVETRLGWLDGDHTTFAAGARDQHLNYEPSAAPVAAGGYFWVVFHTRRTYGNILTGDRSTEKQLWVAAIDQKPQAGKDPSHPAFWLPGQDTTTLNLRGYWSLPPCAANGQSCQSGTDCCGGYCSSGADGGPPVCQSTSSGCSQTGNKCNTTSDCCNSAGGVTCINHVCSEPTPQ
ncbi:MAG TPA: hypothetical protein VF765_31565 [Polyangiaceae bacterium]